MLNLNPGAIDRPYSLPENWLDQLVSYRPAGVLTPLVHSLQAFARKRGKAAIGVEHIQELAIMVCGVSDHPRFPDYEQVFEQLTSAAGSTWPVTMPLEEQRLDAKPVFAAAQQLSAWDGEWLVLRAFIGAGWTPIEPTGRVGRDWTVMKAGRELPIEVKTKQGEGSGLGRLQFALRGLAMIPEGAFINRFRWDWNGGDDLTQNAISEYFELLLAGLGDVEQFIAERPAIYESLEIGSTNFASLSVQRSDEYQFELDCKLTDSSLTSEQRLKNCVSLTAEPNHYFEYAVIGSHDARWIREADAAMLSEIEIVFNRLGIVEQAAKRTSETVVVVIWEVPWYWQIDLAAVETRWAYWCAKSALKHGILLPVRAFDPPVTLFTPDARELLPEGLNL